MSNRRNSSLIQVDIPSLVLACGQEQTSNRGSKGVGILLSPDAARVWHRVAEQKRPNIINDLGARVMAVTLNLDSDKLATMERLLMSSL